MKKHVCVILVAFFSVSTYALQEFESLVVDQKFNSSSTIVIDQIEIQKSRAKNLTSLLATQANISVVQSNFQPATIYLRGGDSSHIIILVDGVPFYDPASPQRTINLNSINLKSVQRIEVIKGSQSVLFGGQALSGVIKIETIPKDFLPSRFLVAQAGTQNSSSIAANVFTPLDENQAVVVRASTASRENDSPVEDSKQVYPSRAATAELAYVYRNPEFEAILKAQTLFDKTNIVTGNFTNYLPLDTKNFETSTYQASVIGIFKLKDKLLDPVLSITAQRNNRIYEQDAISSSGSPQKQDFVGDLFVARLVLLPINNPLLRLQIGASYTAEKLDYVDLDSTRSASGKTDFFGEFLKFDLTPIRQFQLEAGVRADYKKFEDQITTYQLGTTLFENIKAEYSTGFKQPSLFQLYSSYGNLGLQPEKATSASVSYESYLTTNFFASITYFENAFTNLIIAQGTPLKYQNVSNTKTVGVETALALRIPNQKISMNLALGYQEPRDLDRDAWLIRRPVRTASFKINKEFEKLSYGFEVIHNGDRRDQFGPGRFGTVAEYTFANAITEYRQDDKISYFARVQNLTSQKYETSYGFFAERLNLSIGTEITF